MAIERMLSNTTSLVRLNHQGLSVSFVPRSSLRSRFHQRVISSSSRSSPQQEDMEQHKDKLHQPKNPSNQQPTEAGKEGAKSSEELTFGAYGDKYATRSAEEGFGARYGGPHPINPFDKSVKGELAEELGIPELKNRDEVNRKAEVTKETPDKS